MPANSTTGPSLASLGMDIDAVSVQQSEPSTTSSTASDTFNAAFSSLASLLHEKSPSSGLTLGSELCDHPSMLELQAFRDQTFPIGDPKSPNPWKWLENRLVNIARNTLVDQNQRLIPLGTQERVALAVSEVDDLLRMCEYTQAVLSHNHDTIGTIRSCERLI